MKTYLFFFVVVCFANAPALMAQRDTADKSQYHLFNPTPNHLLREMNTDRPDVTETPYTVDAGHFQFEFDIVNFYRHSLGRERRETDILLLSGIAKVGVTDFADFEVIFSANQWHFPDRRAGLGDAAESRVGLGDIGFRAKFNLFGNSHEKYGLAFVPSILLPLPNQASGEAFALGITLIWAVELLDGIGLGGQVEHFRLYGLDRQYLFSEWWGTIEVGFALTERLSSFMEYVAIVGENDAYFHTFNAGAIFEVTPSFRLDAAVNVGLNERSPISFFLGFSFRL